MEISENRQKILDKIAEHNLLTPDGIIVIETEKGGEDALHSAFEVARYTSYGKTVITILKQNTL